MSTAALKNKAFAVWITGLPASGKSTIAKALEAQLSARGVDVAVLESDALRKIFNADYSEAGREAFYRQLALVGSLLVRHGVPVIFDASANRRAYRENARCEIERFIEVYVDVPLEICMARDPKGIYRRGLSGEAKHVPGLQDPYEPPESADVVARGDNPEADARRILQKLLEKSYVK